MKRARALCLVALACSGRDASRARDTQAIAQARVQPAQSADTDEVQQFPDSGSVEVYPGAEMSRIAAELAQRGSSGRTFGGHPAFHYVESRRVVSGTPEIHDDWNDVTLVQAGRATFLTGGHVTGGSLASPGEHRGGAIVGGTPRPIAAGDLIVVAPGIPHQFQVARGDSIRYLTIKIRR